MAWAEIGQSHLQLRQYDQAGEGYESALRLSPENETALVGSSLVALHRGQSDAAVTQLTRAVKIDPSAVNFLLLAQSLRSAGRSAEADAASAQARKISSHWNEAEAAAGQLLSVADVKAQP